jgi:hypothetical protein
VLYFVPRLASVVAILMTVESSLLSAFSNAGAWGMTGLVLIWLTRQREKDLDKSREREDALKTENTELQQKRVEDIGLYATALREVLTDQHTTIRESALAMNSLRELLERLRQEGYILKRPSNDHEPRKASS